MMRKNQYNSLKITIQRKSNGPIHTEKKRADFNFNKAQSVYNINIDENIDYIKIKAVPEQDSYKDKN